MDTLARNTRSGILFLEVGLRKKGLSTAVGGRGHNIGVAFHSRETSIRKKPEWDHVLINCSKECFTLVEL